MRLGLNTRIGGDFAIALITLIGVLALSLAALDKAERDARDVRGRLGPAIDLTSTLMLALEQMETAEDRYFLASENSAAWKALFDKQAAAFESNLLEIDEMLRTERTRATVNKIGHDFASFLQTEGRMRAYLDAGEVAAAQRLNLTTSLDLGNKMKTGLRQLRAAKVEELAGRQEEVEATIARTRWQLFWITLAGLVVGLFYWRRSAQQIVAPLAALQAASRDVARGDFRQVHHPAAGGTTEIQALEADFNTMSAQLATMTAALEEGRHSLESEVALRTSELEAARRNLERMVEDLKAVDKLKSDLMGVMSHELLTPVNFILAYASTLQDEVLGALNPPQQRAVDAIVEGAGRLTRMVRNVLDFTQIESGHVSILPEALPYVPMLQDALAAFRPAAEERRIRLRFDPPGDLPAVYADPSRTWHVLQELLDNAVKFCRESGQVRLSARRMGDVVETAVADEGPGLGTTEVQNLFKPFVQADLSSTRIHGGLGLGLTIAQRLVAAMGGSLLVESRPGEGTIFRFTLPVARDAREGSEKHREEETPAPGPREDASHDVTESPRGERDG